MLYYSVYDFTITLLFEVESVSVHCLCKSARTCLVIKTPVIELYASVNYKHHLIISVKRKIQEDFGIRWRKLLLSLDLGFSSWSGLGTQWHGKHLALPFKSCWSEYHVRNKCALCNPGSYCNRPSIINLFVFACRHLQRFWGASGDFWQTQWTKLHQALGGNEATLFFIG